MAIASATSDLADGAAEAHRGHRRHHPEHAGAHRGQHGSAAPQRGVVGEPRRRRRSRARAPPKTKGRPPVRAASAKVSAVDSRTAEAWSSHAGPISRTAATTAARPTSTATAPAAYNQRRPRGGLLTGPRGHAVPAISLGGWRRPRSGVPVGSSGLRRLRGPARGGLVGTGAAARLAARRDGGRWATRLPGVRGWGHAERLSGPVPAVGKRGVGRPGLGQDRPREDRGVHARLRAGVDQERPVRVADHRVTGVARAPPGRPRRRTPCSRSRGPAPACASGRPCGRARPRSRPGTQAAGTTSTSAPASTSARASSGKRRS